MRGPDRSLNYNLWGKENTPLELREKPLVWLQPVGGNLTPLGQPGPQVFVSVLPRLLYFSNPKPGLA